MIIKLFLRILLEKNLRSILNSFKINLKLLKQKKLLLLMSKERFENYIQEMEKGTNCKEFLEESFKFISNIKKDPEATKEYKIHKALSNIKRFLIFYLLKKKPMCTCALANVFSVSDGTVTHHLKILEDAGLIIGKKEGYFTRYYTVEKLIQYLS
jgi:ArsR family transcriptional regulator